jgi:hypothetical protein
MRLRLLITGFVLCYSFQSIIHLKAHICEELPGQAATNEKFCQGTRIGAGGKADC